MNGNALFAVAVGNAVLRRLGAQAEDSGGQAARPPRAGQEAGPFFASGGRRRGVGERVARGLL